MTRLLVLSAATLVLFGAPLSAQMQTGGSAKGSPRAAVALIAPKVYGARVSKLAHDSMRGRATPSRELDQAADWIASEFSRFGLRPATAGQSFVERYAVEQLQIDTGASSGQLGSARLRMSRDFLVLPLNAPRHGAAEGDVILLATPQDQPQDPLAGVDLRGKVVVEYSDRTDQRADLTVHPDWEHRGLAAIVWVTRAADPVWHAWATRSNLSRLQVTTTARGIPLIAVRARSVERALRAAGVDLAALARDGRHETVVRHVPGLAVRFTLTPRVIRRYEAPNVVGVLRGSDPVLREQYVVFSAHMDHVGVAGGGIGCRAQNGDAICNGADDDASGTAGVISVAEAFAALDPAPKRSLIFLTVSGEERGLWGSEAFTSDPPVPIDDIVADINLDMIGRNWRDTIVAIGRAQSDLGTTLEHVNNAHPELGMTAVDDLWPQEHFYFRSDHYNFARRGVPILFFFNGEHPDYHRPSDHADKIDAEKASRIVKLVFWLGLEVANADKRPQWNPASYREVVGRSSR